MLAIDVENNIRSLLAAGHSLPEICRRLGVSNKAVIRVKQMMELLKCVAPEESKAVKECLLMRIPVKAIELRTRIPHKKISAIRRFYYLQKRQYSGDAPRKCPTCGNMILPRPSDVCEPAQYSVSSESEAILSDIVSLGSLRLIHSPLFCQLSQRAKLFLEKKCQK
jgi:hypothetical protein